MRCKFPYNENFVVFAKKHACGRKRESNNQLCSALFTIEVQTDKLTKGPICVVKVVKLHNILCTEKSCTLSLPRDFTLIVCAPATQLGTCQAQLKSKQSDRCCNNNLTRPANIGHVGINHTMTLKKPYLSQGRIQMWFPSRSEPILLFFSTYFSFQQFFFFLPILLNILLIIYSYFSTYKRVFRYLQLLSMYMTAVLE